MQVAPLRLLLIINVLAQLGGAEVQLGLLAKGLAGRGHEVTVCCLNNSLVPREELRESGVELVELEKPTRTARLRALPQLTKLAKRVDVVHCTMWDPSLWGRIAAIAARRPVIVADHATDRAVQVAFNGAPRASWIALHNRLLDRFTFATVACAGSQRATLTGEGVDPEKIVYIPNGVSVADLSDSAAHGPSREEIGIPDGVPLAVQVGLFRVEKNQMGGLEALARVREQIPDIHLAFVGDGPTMAAVQRRAAELDGEQWVHFLGRRHDAAAIMGLGDLTLLPSTSDAMPMTVLESMAVGVPVIATDVGDVRKTLAEAGQCVPVGDDAAFAQACTELLGERERLARMGASATERAPLFDAEAMVDSYVALFESARNGGSPALPS